MIFMFLGPPGAGKGTLAKQVSQAYGIPHISTGDIFRAAIQEKTPLGLQVKDIIDSGGLVSDRVTTNLVLERLQKDDAKNGCIFDGFPRTIAQAQALEKQVRIDAVVNFDIADEIVIKRLSGRRVCKDCGENFNTEFLPPKKEGICDKCGGALYQREDDRAESISRRIEVYRDQTQPLISFYQDKGLLTTIDATPATKVIFDAFEKAFPKK